MIKEIIKGIIGILIIIGIFMYQESREYLIPALTFIIGYYFADTKAPLASRVLKIFKKKEEVA